MINNGYNGYNGYQYQEYQPFPQGVRQKTVYSVVEVNNNDEILKFNLKPGVTYIFVNENSDRIVIRQQDWGGQVQTFCYVYSAAEELIDPVSRLERRMEKIEKMIGGIANVQSVNSIKGTEKANADVRIQPGAEEASGVEDQKSTAVQRGGGSRQRKD